MIKSLSINNFAIIDKLVLEFPLGLSIITGETGAGKSILLGALALILGERADGKSFFNQEEKCVIEGEFDISDYSLNSFFQEEDLDYDNTVLIRREILPNGKTRAFINDTPVNLKSLQSLTSKLIDIHQQFDTLSIQDEEFQRNAIDALAKQKEIVKEYQSIYKEYITAQKDLETLQAKLLKQSADNEYLNFIYEELVNAGLEPGLQSRLEGELHVLENAELIKKNLMAAFFSLTEAERSQMQQLREVNFLLSAVSKFDKRIEEQQERIQQILPEIEDISACLEQIADKTEYDSQLIEELQTRLNLLYKLIKKHNVQNSDELLTLQTDLESKLEGSFDVQSQIKSLQKEIQHKQSILYKLGENISSGRKSASEFLEKKVHEMLSMLNMEHARIKTSFIPLAEPGPNGLENLKILFSANKGNVPSEIKTVASGGELSRLALCIQSLVASSIPLPTMIFDEIDAGVSGGVALQMGNILRKLSDQHQVVVITHSPQVAAKADKHFYVYKEIIGEQTYTKVKTLDKNQRIHVIASMLSSDPPTQAAIANAQELMEIK